jgi:exopolysaccharide biosynthesis polyprenyl glycosylphosphotransferase
MSSFRRRLLLNLLKLSDIFILLAALFITSLFTIFKGNIISPVEVFAIRLRVINFIGVLGMLILWNFIFNIFQLYRSRRLDSGFSAWKDIVKATTLGMVTFALLGYVFSISLFTPLFLTVFWLSSTALTISFRSLLRGILGRIRRYGRNLRFLLIVGTNQRAQEFVHMIEQKKEHGYYVVGYIDKNIYWSEDKINLLGTLDDFSAILEKYIIDEVVIALPIKSSYEDIQGIVQKSEEQGITIRYLSQMFDTKVARPKAELFEDISVLTMSSGPQEGWQYLAKRVFDIIFSGFLIVLCLPLMVLAAAVIVIDSPGPVLFIQKRVGYNKRIFSLYKFRTMVVNAEGLQQDIEFLNEMDGPVFKMQNDPRITRAGRFFRKASIDELPQLFNVIKKDMSLVGPRPLPVGDYSGFNQDWQRRRFSVLPGLTCTWQVNGRNNIPFDEWMRMDMEYIDTWSLANDIKILFRTIPAVVKGKGAV